MDRDQFRRAHEDCGVALERYVVEAREMCEMLGGCSLDPMPLANRMKLATQRARENEAQMAYLEARQRLFDAARIGYADSV
jgi:hypothetical protein